MVLARIRVAIVFIALAVVAGVALMATQGGQDQTIELKGKWKPPGVRASITYSVDGAPGIGESTATKPVVDGWIWWTTGKIGYTGGPAEITVRLPSRGGGFIPDCEIWVYGHKANVVPQIETGVSFTTATCRWGG